MTLKDQVLIAVRELPQDASIDDIMERIYLLYKIEKGIRQADAGQKVSQELAKKRMQRWLG